MSGALVVVIVSIVLGLVASASKHAKPIETEDGGYLLVYPRAIKMISLGLSLFGVCMVAYVSYVAPVNTKSDLYWMFVLIAFFGFFALYSYIEFFTVKIWVGLTGVRGTSGWRGKREYSWSEISELTYSPITMWYKVSSPNTPTLRIHGWIGGLEQFQKHYMKYMPEEKWKAAHENFVKDKRNKQEDV